MMDLTLSLSKTTMRLDPSNECNLSVHPSPWGEGVAKRRMRACLNHETMQQYQ